jgi:hypothetical protein
VPLWGQPEEGTASEKTLNTPLLSESTPRLACDGVQPGAYSSMADAALGTADNRAALRDTFFLPRRPATSSACRRGMAEAVAHHHWEEGGVLAQTPPPQHRPGTFEKVAEGEVTLYGTTYRAVVVHSSSQDQRRQQHLQRDSQASYATLEATVREAPPQEYCCHADAAAAAATLRALPSAEHGVPVDIEERPPYGPGRPSRPPPRRGKAWRYGRQGTLHERSAVIARKTPETGCFVLLTPVPTAGERAPTARDVLRAYQAQHGIEPNFGFVQAPLMVHSLFWKKPERSEARGLVLLLALLLWRRVERTLRVHVETTETPLPGGDKKATQPPTACMRMTKLAAVMVSTGGSQRQLARPLATVQQPYLRALGVPATYVTMPPRGEHAEPGQRRRQPAPG